MLILLVEKLMSIKNIANFSPTELAESAYTTLRRNTSLVVFENRPYTKIIIDKETSNFYLSKDLYNLLLKNAIPIREQVPKRYFLDLESNICEFSAQVEHELSLIASEKMSSKVIGVRYYAIVDSKTDTALLPFDLRYKCDEELNGLAIRVHTTAYQFWIR